jgi:hypothetical protein
MDWLTDDDKATAKNIQQGIKGRYPELDKLKAKAEKVRMNIRSIGIRME